MYLRIILIIGLVVSLYMYHRSVVDREVESSVATTVTRYTKANQLALDAAKEDGLKKERSLTKNFVAEIGKRDHEIQTIRSARDAALTKLRDRPNRPAPSSADVPKHTTVTEGCTGTGLYQADGQFLIRYAERAAVIAAERDSCLRLREADIATLNSK